MHIAGKRRDGYHELCGLVAFTAFGDHLFFEPANKREVREVVAKSAGCDGGALKLTGPFAAELSELTRKPDDNLVLRAVRLYEQRIGMSFAGRLVLEKMLPLASGVGGGSSDAAAALNLLQDLAPSPASHFELHELARQLGADVPMCLLSKAQWVSGFGEKCQPVPDFPPLACLLVNPLKKVSTAAIFRLLDAPPLAPGYRAEMPEFSSFSTHTALLDWLATQRNDLQAAALASEPEIAKVLEVIAGDENCELARMSGSGATCFGLYRHEGEAREAAAIIAADHPDWWVRATVLG